MAYYFGVSTFILLLFFVTMNKREDDEFAAFQASLLPSSQCVSQIQCNSIACQEPASLTEIVQEQDATLNNLLVSVKRQKEIAICINNELDSQTAVITEMSTSIAKTETKLEKQQSSLAKLLKRFF